jgi:hypothetical protein
MLDLDDLAYNQKAARQLREEHGYEMTPAEVVEMRKSALRKIREGLSDMALPEDDGDLIEWLARVYNFDA